MLVRHPSPLIPQGQGGVTGLLRKSSPSITLNAGFHPLRQAAVTDPQDTLPHWQPLGRLTSLPQTPLTTYLLDAFGIYAASAVAATTVFLALFAAILPLGGNAMYESLHLGWGNSLLGFIALAFDLVPIAFYRWGERLRKSFKLKL